MAEDKRHQLARKLMEVYWYENMSENSAGVTEHALRLADYVIAEQQRVIDFFEDCKLCGNQPALNNGFYHCTNSSCPLCFPLLKRNEWNKLMRKENL